MSRKSLLVVPALLIVLIGALFALTRSRPIPAPAVSQEILHQETGVPVRVSPIRVQDVNNTLDVTGQLQADSVTDLSTKIPGKVEFVAVRAGQNVTRGQLLIRLDAADADRQLHQAEAGVQQARAAVRTAEARLSQARTAARVGDTQANAAVEAARATLRSAQARLELVRTGARRQERLQAQNQVSIAKANLDKAQTDYNRFKKLFDQGAVPAATLDTYSTQLDVARSQYNNALQAASIVEEGARVEEVRQAESGVEQARESLRSAIASQEASVNRQEDVRAALAGVATARAQLESANAGVAIARQNVSNFKIYAPTSGTITQRNVEPGQWANPGIPLLTIVDLSTVYLQAEVSETDVARVSTDQPVMVRVDSYPDRTWAGRVQAIVSSADPASRTFRVRVRVHNQGGSLKPFMFARASITTGVVEDALVVPRQAVITRDGRSIVVRVVDGEAEPVPVQTGATTGNLIVVRSPALSVGDQVVIEGQQDLSPGQKVKSV